MGKACRIEIEDITKKQNYLDKLAKAKHILLKKTKNTVSKKV